MDYQKSKVSIIIACKNEGEGIKRILRSVGKFSNDIIVVDGHSNDGTEKISKEFGARFFLDNKKGRGDALKIGIKNAKNEICVFFDADGSHDERDIPLLIEPIVKNSANMVIGSRRTGGSFDVNVNLTGIIRAAGCDFLVSLVNHKYKTSLTDILYSFRAIRTSTAKKLNFKSNDFGIEQEMVVSCLKKRYKVKEIPSREKARGWGKSKLHTLTGIKFLAVLLRDLYL
ncbi:MAG: glycosyltransferase [Patescibacteria group bacterium]